MGSPIPYKSLHGYATAPAQAILHPTGGFYYLPRSNPSSHKGLTQFNTTHCWHEFTSIHAGRSVLGRALGFSACQLHQSCSPVPEEMPTPAHFFPPPPSHNLFSYHHPSPVPALHLPDLVSIGHSTSTSGKAPDYWSICDPNTALCWCKPPALTQECNECAIKHICGDLKARHLEAGSSTGESEFVLVKGGQHRVWERGSGRAERRKGGGILSVGEWSGRQIRPRRNPNSITQATRICTHNITGTDPTSPTAVAGAQHRVRRMIPLYP